MPETWQVIVLREPEKLLARLPRDVRRRLSKAIDDLETSPHPPSSERLTGYDLYRLRVGDWRIIYRVNEAAATLDILAIRPRSGAYR